MRQSRDKFVERVDFVTTVGFGSGHDDRRRLGLCGGGPRVVITDLGTYTPDPATSELMLTSLHPGVTVDDAKSATGWELRVAPELHGTDPPTADELAALRSSKGRDAAPDGGGRPRSRLRSVAAAGL